MKVAAAVLHETGRPLAVEEVDLAEPRADEVRVRLLASGICHSDLSLADGKWPAPLPMVLGHEGAGVIEAVGPGVSEERVGEHVVLTFTPACGRCRFCLMGRVNLCTDAARCMDDGVLRDGTTRLSLDGRPVHHLALVSSFATHAVAPSAGAIAIPPSLDPAHACLLGCGVLTGFASVVRRAGVRPGESVAVFACGGVGLSTVLRRKLVSAWPIIAVDPIAPSASWRCSIGATHALDPGRRRRRRGDPRRSFPTASTTPSRRIGAPDVAEPGVRRHAHGRHDGADRPAGARRARRASRLRADAVRARPARHAHRRRDAGARHPRARGAVVAGVDSTSPRS